MTRSPTLALALLTLFAPRPAFARPPFACTCGATPSAQDARARASAVFVGRVLSRVALRAIGIGVMAPGGGTARTSTRKGQADTSWGRGYIRVTFLVSRAWKGVAQDTVSVVTGSGGGDCGYPLYVDGVYLVYAFWAPERSDSYVSICGRTRALAESGRDLAVLGAPGYKYGGHANAP